MAPKRKAAGVTAAAKEKGAARPVGGKKAKAEAAPAVTTDAVGITIEAWSVIFSWKPNCHAGPLNALYDSGRPAGLARL